VRKDFFEGVPARMSLKKEYELDLEEGRGSTTS